MPHVLSVVGESGWVLRRLGVMQTFPSGADAVGLSSFFHLSFEYNEPAKHSCEYPVYVLLIWSHAATLWIRRFALSYST